MYDWRIDPTTGDYIQDGRGGFETTTTIVNRVLHQLSTDLDLWVGAADQGNDVWRLPRKSTQAMADRVAESYRAALQRLVDSGAAADLSVAVDRDQVNRFVVTVSLRDVQTGQLVTQTVPVGA